MEVVPDSPAAGAGLQAGDWITAVDGAEVGSANGNLAEIIGGYEPGDEITVDFQRSGEAMSASITLGANPDTGSALLGVRFQPLPFFGRGGFDRGDSGTRVRLRRSRSRAVGRAAAHVGRAVRRVSALRSGGRAAERRVRPPARPVTVKRYTTAPKYHRGRPPAAGFGAQVVCHADCGGLGRPSGMPRRLQRAWAPKWYAAPTAAGLGAQVVRGARPQRASAARQTRGRWTGCVASAPPCAYHPRPPPYRCRCRAQTP